ncbi:hypothetical protein [Saccharopolyspora sp. 5N708]|uniref:hypothetical protein n=1 Tax=Saccharopolyspora sp. 5N708 TaxID=3457424 RepID=UPI003FD1FF2A
MAWRGVLVCGDRAVGSAAVLCGGAVICGGLAVCLDVVACGGVLACDGVVCGGVLVRGGVVGTAVGSSEVSDGAVVVGVGTGDWGSAGLGVEPVAPSRRCAGPPVVGGVASEGELSSTAPGPAVFGELGVTGADVVTGAPDVLGGAVAGSGCATGGAEEIGAGATIGSRGVAASGEYVRCRGVRVSGDGGAVFSANGGIRLKMSGGIRPRNGSANGAVRV